MVLGQYLLRDHEDSPAHQANLNLLIGENTAIDIKCKQREVYDDPNVTADKISLIEAALCYHCVRFSQSYNSLESLGYLLKAVLTTEVHESTQRIFDKLALGRTKATAIVSKVLAKRCIDEVNPCFKLEFHLFCFFFNYFIKTNLNPTGSKRFGFKLLLFRRNRQF